MKKVFLICLLAFTLTGCAKPVQLPQKAQTNSYYLSAAYDEPDERLKLTKAFNSDTAAWLTIPNSNIDGAVMQSKDNSYYLRRNENKQHSVMGCFYADYECNLAESSQLSQNIIVYGHTKFNDEKEEKFFQLKHFTNTDWAEEHNTIKLSVKNEMLTYRAVAVVEADTKSETDTLLIAPQWTNEELEKLNKLLAAKNQLGSDFQLQQDDKILTLVTCTEDTNVRLVVISVCM